jgi:hypothetical protein
MEAENIKIYQLSIRRIVKDKIVMWGLFTEEEIP